MSNSTPTNHFAPASGEPLANLVPIGQYIKDLSFENPNILRYAAEKKSPPEVSINVQVQAHQAAESVFEVELIVTVEGKYEEEVALVIELTYAGVFASQLTDPDQLKPLMLIEAPTLLFPFARQIIASITQQGGMMPPLLLQPMDFSQLYENQQVAEPLAASAN